MGLTPEVIIELLDLLDNKDVVPPFYQVPTFERIWLKAQHILRNSDKPSVGKTLLYFIKQKYILKTDCQKLIAVFLLTLLFRDEPDSSLYLSSVARIVEGVSYDNELTTQKHAFYTDLPLFAVSVRNFLSMLLSPNANMVMKYNPYDVLEGRLLCPRYNFNEKSKAWDEDLPHAMKSSIPLLIPVPLAPDPIGAVKKCVGHYDLKSLLPLVVGENAPAQKYYAPKMARLSPPSHFCLDEFAWFGFKDFSSVVCAYDSAFLDKATSDKARELVSTAVDNSLPTSKHSELEKLIRKNPKLAFSLGITPENYPKLVESNPQIAITALSKMILVDSITDYLTGLVNMPLSLHSLEVVNVMTTGSVRLPEEFTNLYTSNCIVACEKMKDTPVRNRFVRLVGIFLQSLIRNNVINLQAMYIEIHSFCVEFRNFREAATLYRLIKTKERLENLDFGCDDDIFSEEGRKMFESKKKTRRGRGNKKKVLEIKEKEATEKGLANKDEASTSKVSTGKNEASTSKVSDNKNKASTSKVSDKKNKANVVAKAMDSKEKDDKKKIAEIKVKVAENKKENMKKVPENKEGDKKKVAENKKKVPDNKGKGNNANGNKTNGNNADGNKAGSANSNGNGGNANGNKVNGNNANDNKASGSNANGNKVNGNNANGNKATGSNANGNKVNGNNATGNKASGSNANGNKVNGNNATGNKASGSNANGNKVNGNNATGNKASGSNGNGNKVNGSSANGKKASGSNANGNKVNGNNANGNKASGSNANGNKVNGNNANGNKGSNSNANGQKANSGNANGSKVNGDNANGNNSSGNKANGSNANGHKVNGDNANGNKAGGSNANGTKLNGSNANGNETSSSIASGDKASGSNANGNGGSKKNRKKKSKK